MITTNGNSYQFAGDNTGNMFIGGPGAQFRGKSDGNVYINGDGAFVLGTIASLATVTNRGKGALLLANLTPGQKAEITGGTSRSTSGLSGGFCSVCAVSSAEMHDRANVFPIQSRFIPFFFVNHAEKCLKNVCSLFAFYAHFCPE